MCIRDSDTQAIGLGGKDARVLVTCAMPVPTVWLVEAGLGRDRLAATTVERGTIVSRVERVYACLLYTSDAADEN